MRETPTLHESNPFTTVVMLALVSVIALGIRLAHYENEPITDELYHLLAAESWVEDGSFDIADGSYTRASVFTMFVGVAHAAGGGNVNTIRVLCIVIGALLVVSVAWWTARYAGAGAGLIAGSLLAILPSAIFLAQYIRFYTLHALVFFLLAWCAWDLNRIPGPRRRWIVLLLTVALVLLGVHLQVTTMVGIAGLAVWLIVANHKAILNLLPDSRRRWLAGALILAALLILAFALRGTVRDLVQTYYASALWNSSDTALYYFNLYRRDFGALWSLAPAAFVIALFARPGPAFFCTCIFVVAFVVQSLGGMRSERFMFYALPFFFIIWGIAFDVIGRASIDRLRQLLAAYDIFANRRALKHWLPAVAVIAIGLFALVTTPFFETFAKMTLGKRTDPPDYWDRYRTNWAQVAPFVREVRGKSDVVIASQPLHAIYYLGDVDYGLNATMLADIAQPGSHAKIDSRTGRVIFDDVASLKSVIDCHRSGSVIIHGPAFGNPTRVSPDVANYIEANLETVTVSGRTNLLVFRWQNAAISGNCRLHDGRWMPDGDR